MERSLLEKHLAVAERNVRLGTVHLDRQRALVATYERLGRNTTLARDLLKTLEEMKVEHISHRDRLLRDLRSTSLPPPVLRLQQSH